MLVFFFFFQAEDGIRDDLVTGVQTCALPIYRSLVGRVSLRYNRSMIQIVDYGMGNLRSVQKAFERLSVPAAICTRPNEIADCNKLILPGVGAFRDAIPQLRPQEFVAPINAPIPARNPFLPFS